jgi:hypothetical protein
MLTFNYIFLLLLQINIKKMTNRLTNTTLTTTNCQTNLFSCINQGRKVTISTNNSTTSVDYTAAECFGGVILRSSTNTVSDDLPSATDLNNIAYSSSGLDNSSINSLFSFDFILVNIGSNQVSVGNGSGSTLYGQAILPAGAALRIRMIRQGVNLWHGLSLTGDG